MTNEPEPYDITKENWTFCGHERGGCNCMQVGSESGPVATVESGNWGDPYPSLRFVEGTQGSLDPKIESYMDMIVYGSIPPEIAKQRACLISASPDLLRALQGMLEAYDDGCQPDWARPFIEKAHAAIRKAKQ